MSQELSRSLKPRHIAMISVGGIVGAGLFVGSSAAIAATGPAVVLSYLITGVLVLLVMRCLGEMAVALPKLRTFTEFPRAGLGAWAGFVAGWLYWYFWAVTVPVEAIAGAKILHQWLPQFSPTAVGLGLMAVMTGVNLMSARSYGEFEFWFSSIKVAAILVFIVVVASYAFGWAGPPGGSFAALTSHGGFMPKGLAAVLAGAVTVFFQLTGAEITTVAAAESSEPTRAVARMSTSVVVRILAFYVGLDISDRLGNALGQCEGGRIALHPGVDQHGSRLGGRCHVGDHPDGSAVLPEFGVLCVFARAVRPGRAWRCAARAGALEFAPGSGVFGLDERALPGCWGCWPRLKQVVGVCLSHQQRGLDHCVRLHDGHSGPGSPAS